MRLKFNFFKMLFLLGIVLISGCSKIPKEPTIKINLEKKSQISITDLISRIELVPIETNNNFLIKYIIKTICHDSYYYILDNNKAVYKLDKVGNLMYEIGKLGRGPQEHTAVVDIQINEFTNNIELLIPTGKINVFNIRGEFIKSIPIHTFTNNFINLNEDIIVLYFAFGKNKLIFYSRSKNKIISRKISMDEKINKVIPGADSAPLWRYNGNVYFQYPFFNEIDRIVGLNVSVAYKLDFGKYNFNLKDINWNTGLNRNYYARLIKSPDLATFFHRIVETDSFILGRFLNGDETKMPYFLYNKEKEGCIVFTEFKEKVTFPFIYNYDFEHHIIYAAIEPGNLKDHIYIPLLDEESQKTLKNLKVEDNPIIVKYFLK